MYHKTLALVIVLLFTQFAIAQTVDVSKPSEDKAKLEKEAVAFLRETMSDVNSLRSLENRISFSSEMAGLMWFHDEREAKSMFASAVGDFKQLLMQYDGEMNSLGIPADGEEFYGGRGFLGGDTSERGRVQRKFRTAMAVRQQIAMSIAEHDADLAYSFYYDSMNVISNAEFRKQLENNDQSFEYQLMTQIAETNAAKAAQIGVKSLAKGLKYQHVELLKKIYAKDPDKGAEFASALLSRVKSEKLGQDDFWAVSSFLEFASGTLEASRKPGGKKAVLSQSDLRDLADTFGQAVLNWATEETGSGMQYVSSIEKYAPGRAAQIRARASKNTVSGDISFDSTNVAEPVYRGSANTAANVMSTGGSGYGSGSTNSNSAANREREERESNERQMMEDVMKVGTKELPKEAREKIVSQARKILNQTPGKDKKIMGLSMLAAQVAKAGDKELAGEIMRDAQNLVNPSPKNYQDFLFSWMLASGYAQADPDKAFPILEETIGRANETISAFIKVGEFIDVAEEMIVDGEVQVGAFGGQMVRGLTKELGVADATIQVLARADFAKTKGLTNRFDRPEVRILAKMMVLRAVLGGTDKPDGAEISIEMPDGGN
jgi:hypothetical protein